MENKKLIVTDLDGTALQSWESLDPKTKEALMKAKEEGHIVVIATGRPARASLHFYKELGLDTPIINFNGAYIHHPEDDSFEDILAQIPTEVIITLFDSELQNYIVNAFCEYKDHLYVLHQGDTIRDWFHIDTCTSVKFGPFKETLDEHPNGFLLETKKGMAEEVMAFLREHYSDIITCRNWDGDNDNIIEVFKSDTNKATAIEKLAKYYNIEPKDIIAFGDGDNDIEMLMYAGVGVAMDNAIDKLKEAANTTTKSNKESGVAHYLEQYILTK
ncbi:MULTISPECIES: Cof-type HAD-IIB family hydrolase [Turicibacter]|jgi:putative phosphatase yitU|uniref:Cof-type HAD-IIB family hydrolase n=2 Tax=Turicibacter sanguinis TaxID=154288 RepID=A0A173SXV8_9FIRM|nr:MULTISPECIES: Cof-type HAD-IIB family hydrolase [Turicibacter]EFF64140.1 Cof-like hydrolase [Turicibacter sanguinis PC909]EGC92289.1 Cof-like hydrolase [Turicibacter sp. HGF1]MBP3903131.1 Cof-type HAD-IIB family hydrolase [Turicibacter sp.]MCU7192011.1 Cof-type HAD-IIB family hydrolase [Turicibacter sanguinis]MCU7197594.1 Cof-type HAD-IIB family hydrolase [Turicibacter sanguinis]